MLCSRMLESWGERHDLHLDKRNALKGAGVLVRDHSVVWVSCLLFVCVDVDISLM